MNILDHSYFIRVLECLLTREHRSLLLLVDEILGRGFDGQLVIGGLAAFCRDLLVAQHPDTLSLLEKPESIAQQYLSLAQRCTSAQLFAAIKALVQCDQQYRAATNKRLLIELTLLSLISSFASGGTQPQAAQQTTPAASTASTAQGAAVQARPAAPQGAPQPTTSGVAPTPAPVAAAPQPSPTPSPTATQPVAAVQESPTAPAPQPAGATSTAPVISVQEEEARRGRERFRGVRRRPSQQQAAAETPTAAEPITERESFDELALQRAWMAFVEQVLPAEEIAIRKTMSSELPVLLEPTLAEVRLTPSAAIIEPINELLPRITYFLQKQLHNGALTLRIQAKEMEIAQTMLSSEARLEQMEHNYPALGKLRERLHLRLQR